MAIINGVAKSSDAPFYPYEIDQSLRFNDDDVARLTFTPSLTGNRQTLTYSAWFKRSNLTGGQQFLMHAGNSDSPRQSIGFSDVDDLSVANSGIGAAVTSALYRDVSAFYHIVIAIDTTQAVEEDRIKIYVNGIPQNYTRGVSPVFSLNELTEFNTSGIIMALGVRADTLAFPIDGYLAETWLIDGLQLDATSFGEFKNEVWIPKQYEGVTSGTNTCHLNYSDNLNIGADTSGNGNNWTPTNLASTDVVLDSPTNNWCTLNPLVVGTFPLSQGNLKLTLAVATIASSIRGSHHVGVSKYYYEGVLESFSVGSVSNNAMILGFQSDDSTCNYGWIGDGAIMRHSVIYAKGGALQTRVDIDTTPFTSTDVLGVSLDNVSGIFKTYKNGVETASIDTSLSLDETFYPHVQRDGTSNAATWSLNYGQDSSFAGNKPTGSANAQDANGLGDFYYPVPAGGYLALCTANLPESVFSPHTGTQLPSDNFNTVLYSGTSTLNPVTGMNFQPDFLMLKARTSAQDFRLFDIIRGIPSVLLTPTVGLESTTAEFVSLDTDGFTVTGVANAYNASGQTYVAWGWKADNTTGTINNNGSLTSTVATNLDAGFSIVNYTGQDVAGNTVGHGLPKAPDFMIIKNLDDVFGFVVYSSANGGTPETDYFYLNQNLASASATTVWNDTAPTDTVFTLGTSDIVNGLNEEFIAYCWNNVEGYSKAFSFEGNASADGTFVYLGFKPAWLILKSADSTSDWFIYDNRREGYNVDNDHLNANLNAVEATTDEIDFLSNGFKLRIATDPNVAETYIGFAIAEMPFKYSNAV